MTNNGGSTAGGTFYTELLVDGTYKTNWSTTALTAGNYTYVTGYSLGTLSAGTHTIEIYTDYTNAVTESNESDNTYTKTITVLALPNLTPYTPSGWSAPVVVSTTSGDTTDSSPLYTTSNLYVDWAVQNNGGSTAGGTFYTELLVDGTYKTNWSTTALTAGNYTYFTGYSLGTLSAGTHTIEIYTDYTNAVTESNESDNTYTKTITVLALPNLTPYTPSGWSAPVVVSTTSGGTTDSSPLYTNSNLYVDWAVTNNGGSTAGGTFYTELLVDGTYETNWSTTALTAGNYTYTTSAQCYNLGASWPVRTRSRSTRITRTPSRRAMSRTTPTPRRLRCSRCRT